MIALLIGDQASQAGEQRAAGNRGDDPGGAALGVPAQAADREREDGGEDARFEKEDERQGGDAALAAGAHGGGDEDHDTRHEDKEDPAGFSDHHGAGGGEATDGEEALADGVAVGGGGVGDVGGFDGVFDELACDADLGADVAELRSDAKEEFVLLAEGFVGVAGQAGALFGLQGHVGVGDFGDRGDEEDGGEEEDEGGDAEVGPLHGGEVFGVGVFEEDAGGEKGGHDRADSLEGLGELEAEFGEPGRAAGGDEGVCGGFESGEAGADDEEGAAEAGEGAVHGRGPEHEGADAVDGEARHEGVAVAPFADDVAGVGWGTDQVGAEVGALEAAGFGGGDIEGVLEFGVEDVEEAVGETPEEEEDGDEDDGKDRLADGKGRGAGEAFIGDAFAVLLLHGFGVGGPALLEDFSHYWLFFGSEPHGCGGVD